ncbi:Fatty+acid+oxidation+complex+subunit+alpha [Methylocapsa aurea]|uniref:crotonase/enoyl-CoA hydratase family protein n=1 Tax=Methylocapsa aurea TaxID=663610 RepID=UPI003D1879A2
MYHPRDPRDFPNWEFEHLDVEYDPATQAVWMQYKASAPHFYPIEMFLEILDLRESVRALFESGVVRDWPVRYFAAGSNKDTVFALGGDLAMFVDIIKQQKRDFLTRYAHVCIDVMYGLRTAFSLPIVTLSAVHGQCLGGGFEGVLVTDFLIAEETAKFGVPEVAFNTFPGMGAVTLLTQRVGSAMTETIISSGAVYSGLEMHQRGIVDVLAASGHIRAAADAWMAEGGEERWLRRRTLADARRSCFPVSHEELLQIVDLWVDCCFSVTDQDLRHMSRLVAAQKRLPARRQSEPTPSRDGKG